MGVLELSTGQISSIRYGRLDIDVERMKVLREKYRSPQDASSDPFEHARQRLELAKIFLETDGYSGPSIAFLKPDEPPRISPAIIPPASSREMRIAQLVRQHGAWPYDAAVHSSEVWTSMLGIDDLPAWMKEIKPSDYLLAPKDSIYDPDPVGDRQETILVTALTSDRKCLMLYLPFAMTKLGIKYGPVEESTDPQQIPRFLRPIWRNWPEWNKQ